MSSFKCCFLTCTQVSQEAGQVVWYSHLFKNFPQFVVIHTVKGLGIVNREELDVFLELSCLFNDPTDVGSLISDASAFSKTSLNIWKFLVHILLKPCLENFKHYFASMRDECNCAVVWTLFGTAFLWDLNENWLFQSCGHCWVFQSFRPIECSTLTTSSFRIWNNSAGIPSPPLALLIVMLPKAHLTSHSRMSGFRWVITPSWLSGSWRSFLHSSVCFCYLFLISSASQPCLTQWNYEPPKTDGSWWRDLTKCGPLEKGMANHFTILALRTPWTVWKGKKIWHWKMNFPSL